MADPAQNRQKVEAMKMQIGLMETAEDRREVWLLWAEDKSVHRADLLLAMKEMGLNDQFEFDDEQPKT